ncbi:MAG: tetratricopeptide repeat protein [Candidatus Hydrogenedentes bacterium]|nr:tetratricopeptide repeat protein [Candidatus Hydrogenedentota bacterium]
MADFGQAWQFAFLDYDDPRLVTEHPEVAQGLSAASVQWAWTHFHFGVWMPLTSLSHLLDVSLFGDWAGGHHLTSVLLHTVNAALLFLALRRLTGCSGRSFFVAAAFAAHPVVCEPVLWIASRKDVLSALFFLLLLLAYRAYVERPGLRLYLLVLASLSAGLLAKPMLVTAPFVLLLLDYWPLRRLNSRADFGRLFKEKVPLLGLAAVAAGVAFFGQRSLDAMTGLASYPLWLRVVNAVVSYCRYLYHVIYPVPLAVHYPPVFGWLQGWQAIGASLLLLMITALVLWLRRERYLLVGWCWFLGMLAPVIGIVYFGHASMADRFLYLPGIGLYLMVAWGAPRLLDSWPRAKPVLGVAAAVVVLGLAVLAHWQARFWRDTESLCRRALVVTRNNDVALTLLGDRLLAEGRAAEGLPHLREAMRLKPDLAARYYDQGTRWLNQGRYEDAERSLLVAVEGEPGNAQAQTNLGVAQLQNGKLYEAIPHLSEAVRLEPMRVNARINYGVALLRAGEKVAAAEEFRTALKLDPENAAARANLALTEPQ